MTGTDYCNNNSSIYNNGLDFSNNDFSIVDAGEIFNFTRNNLRKIGRKCSNDGDKKFLNFRLESKIYVRLTR